MNTYLSIPISPENREIELDHMIYSLIFIPVFIHVPPVGRPPAPLGWGWMCTGVWWTAPAPPSSSPWAGHCSRVRYDNTIYPV